MIKKWNQFIREFVENSDSLIDVKMQELKDLVDGVSDGQNFIYEWENKDDHRLSINFSNNQVAVKYEFDIDGMTVTKIVGENVDFTEDVTSIDEALDIIEKDIQLILGISESMKIRILNKVKPIRKR